MRLLLALAVCLAATDARAQVPQFRSAKSLLVTLKVVHVG